MKISGLFILIITIAISSSCATKNKRYIKKHLRSPSSFSLQYPEFSLKRVFIVNKNGCQITEGDHLLRGDYKFDEFKDETSITYYASKNVLEHRFNQLYKSKRRLKNRMYLEDNTFWLTHNGSKVEVNENFLNSLAHQIEMAFRMNVVEYLFYSDFGHAHLYLPVHKSDTTMNEALSDPSLKLIYHTAEQLMMKNGSSKRDHIDYRQYRYRTRNLIGSFDVKGSLEVHYAHNNAKFNTLHEIPGFNEYAKIGKTLYFSANQNGCIGYKVQDTIHYFDISFTH